MEFVRIGDKVISRDRINSVIDKILELRAAGLSQQEVAEKVQVDRSFVSRVETLGEIRKGGRVAVIGFPVKNKEELTETAKAMGADLVLLMTEEERWGWVRSKSGLDLINEVMALVTQTRDFDTLIFIGSDERLRFVEALVGRAVLGIEIGRSPLKEDQYVDPELLRRALSHVKG